MTRRTGNNYSGARWAFSDGTPRQPDVRPGGHGVSETTLPPMPLDSEHIRNLRKAGQRVQHWTAERDRLIKEAIAAGGSLREVGEAAGLSHTAVKFIAHGRPNR